MALIMIEGFDDNMLASKGWNAAGSYFTGRFTGSSMRPRFLSNDCTYTFQGTVASVLIVGFALQLYSCTTGRTIMTLGRVMLKIATNGYLQLCRSDTGAQIAITATPYWTSDGVWRYIECKYDSGTGATDVHIDGVSVMTGTVPAPFTVAALQFTQCNGTSSDYGLDDLYVIDTTGTANNSFLGDVRVQTILPIADGANTGMTPSTGTAHYPLVNETTPNTTNYVSAASSGLKDTYQFTRLPTNIASVYGVAVSNYSRKDATGPASIANVVRSGSVDYVGTAIALSAAWTGNVQLWEKNPSTSAAWTPATVDAAEFGVSSS